MNKWSVMLLGFLSTTLALAQSQGDAIKARDGALQALKGFNPATVFKGYTSNPYESKLLPQEGSNPLGAQGLSALKNHSMANDVYNQAGSRAKIQFNPGSYEMKYAEQLLENPESVLEGACYKQPEVCENQSVINTCDESVNSIQRSCKDTLNVMIKSTAQSFSRTVSTSKSQTITFNLHSCGASDLRCSAVNTAHFTPHCESLVVSVIRNKKNVQIMKQPTCADPSVTVKFSGRRGRLASMQVTVTEYASEDQWNRRDCQRLQSEHTNGQCILEGSSYCLEPNQMKLIGGIAIRRSCWGRGYYYSCISINQNECSSFVKQGCTQTASICAQANSNRCERYTQTFSCIQKICMPEKTICPEKIECSDGQCDPTQEEISEDITQGVSRLGALASGAGEVSSQQVKSGSPAIFTGMVKECKKYPLGLRDCCTDSGWGDWIKHCPPDLQDFQRAKQENRVVYLGSYKNHKLGARHFTYCVFPTKLASIVQIQGRGHQLNISYGTAELPNCRGITPEELERINFAALDLSPIQQELILRMNLPKKDSIYNTNQSHIERLKEKGRAHD